MSDNNIRKEKFSNLLDMVMSDAINNFVVKVLVSKGFVDADDENWPSDLVLAKMKYEVIDEVLEKNIDGFLDI